MLRKLGSFVVWFCGAEKLRNISQKLKIDNRTSKSQLKLEAIGKLSARQETYRKHNGYTSSHSFRTIKKRLITQKQILLSVCRFPRNDRSSVQQNLDTVTGRQNGNHASIIVRNGNKR